MFAGRTFRRGRSKSFFLAAVVTLLGAIIVPQPLERGPSAAAALGNGQVLLDQALYGADEIVYASGVITYLDSCTRASGVRDYFQPFADIYVIDGIPTAGAKMQDVAGSPNVVFGSLASGFIDQILAITVPNGSLDAGDYTVVIDECQDGFFDQEEDSIFIDELKVRLPSQLPRHSEIGQIGVLKNKADAMEARSRAGAEGWARIMQSESALSHYGRLNVLDPVGAIQAWIMWGLEQSTQILIPGAADPKAGATAATVSNWKHWKGLAADPPDPAFNQPDVAVAGLPILGVEDAPEQTALLDASDEIRIENALLGALVSSFERYQGAVAAGNDKWGLAHLRSAARLARLLADQLDETADALDTAVAVVDAGPALDTILNDIESFQDATETMGTIDEVQLTLRKGFRNLGVDDAGFDLIKEFFNQSVDEALNEAPLRALLADHGVANRDMATFLRSAAGDFESTAIAAESLSSVEADWVQADAGGPYSTAPGVPVALDASGSIGTGLGHSWDLNGDGVFGDATGVAPSTSSFTIAGGSYLIAVEVTDGEGRVDVDHAVVHVDDLAAPAVTVVQPLPQPAPSVRMVELQPGQSQVFELATAGSVEWYVDDVLVSSSNSTTLTAGATNGVHRIVANVTGANGQVRRLTFLVFVVGVDGDGDTWYSSPGPDCDDTTGAVSPQVAEIIGNGIDDDCNTDSNDDGNAPTLSANPTADFSVTSGGWRDRIQEGERLRGEFAWSHPSRLSGQPFDFTVDFGDGTTETGTLQGTTTADTAFAFDHIVGRAGNWAIDYCLTAPGGHQTCQQAAYQVLRSEPVIHPSDPSLWTHEHIGEGLPAGNDPLWLFAPYGATASQESNPNYPTMLISPFDLPDGGRISFDMVSEYALDNDGFGMALGVQPGETTDAAGDWIWIEWDRNAYGAFLLGGNCPNTSPNSDITSLALTRVSGLGNLAEYYSYNIFDDATSADPTCNDAQGVRLLDEIVLPLEVTHRSATGQWSIRTAPLQVGNAWIADLYHFDVEYSADRIRVWIDGFLAFDVAASAVGDGSAFPMGRVALVNKSQSYVRYQAHVPVPEIVTVEGADTLVSADIADGGITDVLIGQFSWNDGTDATPATIADAGTGLFTATATHAWPDNGHFDADLCVEDTTDDVIVCEPVGVTVSNADPVVKAGPDRVSSATTDLLANFTDPGADDTHTATVDWGDGSPVESGVVDQGEGYGAISGSHTFTTDGVFTVTVCVTDDDGGVGCDSVDLELQATAVAPVAQVLSGVTGDEGASVEVHAGFTDLNLEQGHTVTIDWGDGNAPEAVTIQDGGLFGDGGITHTYTDDDSFAVVVEACDGASLCDEAATTVAIANVAPTLVLDPIASVQPLALDRADQSLVVGGPGVQLTGTFTDAGSADTHIFRVDWGDGVTNQVPAVGGAVSHSHVYASDGVFAVRACVVDDDGGESCLNSSVELVGAVVPTTTAPPASAAPSTTQPASSATVAPTPSVSPSDILPSTGGDPARSVKLAVLVAALGTVLVMIARRRRLHHR